MASAGALRARAKGSDLEYREEQVRCTSRSHRPKREPKREPNREPKSEHELKVEIWSDVVCPWCYIGKRRFEQALARFEHRDEVEVVWKSFELDPSAPARRDGDNVERLAKKYGMSVSQAQA